MTELAVTPQIIQSLATYLKRDPSTITESHHLRDDLGLDSVAIIELLFEIEDRFKIQIPDQDLQGLSTVGSVADYVQRRLSAGDGAGQPKAKPAGADKKPAAPPPKPAASRKSKSTSPTKKPASAPKKGAAIATTKRALSKTASTQKKNKR